MARGSSGSSVVEDDFPRCLVDDGRKVADGQWLRHEVAFLTVEAMKVPANSLVYRPCEAELEGGVVGIAHVVPVLVAEHLDYDSWYLGLARLPIVAVVHLSPVP